MNRRAGVIPLALVLALALTACAHRKTPPPIVADPSVPCQTETLTALIGRSGSAVLASEALGKSGARTIRWIRPHEAVTMDFREDRLNIELDRDDLVTHFTCG